jgi:flagellar biosynthetic protein FlhB
VEAPALARALYRHGELDTPVPATLYLAVAQVMAYLYQLDDWVRQGGAAPLPLGAIAVPDGLDPGLQ